MIFIRALSICLALTSSQPCPMHDHGVDDSGKARRKLLPIRFKRVEHGVQGEIGNARADNLAICQRVEFRQPYVLHNLQLKSFFSAHVAKHPLVLKFFKRVGFFLIQSGLAAYQL